MQSGQPFFLLLGRTEGVNGIHHQRALHGDEAAQARIAAFEFLHDLAVGNVGHAGAIVAGEIGAKKSQFGHLRHQMQRESGFAIVLLDDRKDFAVHELARRLANEALVVVQQRIDFEEIDTGKTRHVIPARVKEQF